MECEIQIDFHASSKVIATTQIVLSHRKVVVGGLHKPIKRLLLQARTIKSIAGSNTQCILGMCDAYGQKAATSLVKTNLNSSDTGFWFVAPDVRIEVECAAVRLLAPAIVFPLWRNDHSFFATEVPNSTEWEDVPSRFTEYQLAFSTSFLRSLSIGGDRFFCLAGIS